MMHVQATKPYLARLHVSPGISAHPKELCSVVPRLPSHGAVDRPRRYICAMYINKERIRWASGDAGGCSAGSSCLPTG